MFIDTHAHIYLDQFDQDYAEMIHRARAAKIDFILMPNIDLASMDKVWQCHHEHRDYCLPMVGLHPCSVDRNWEDQLALLAGHLNRDGVIAIGEIGVDLYWDTALQQEQEDAFATQITWALEHDLPIVIHSRSAIRRTIDIVSHYQDGQLRGVFHCFDQSWDEAGRILDLGMHMGIGGVSTYKKNNVLREAIRKIPLDHIILETDAPYLPPVPHRGSRNEPAYIPLIARQIAEVKQMEVAQVAEETSNNAQRLFQISI